MKKNSSYYFFMLLISANPQYRRCDDVDDVDDGYEGWRVSEWEDDEKVDYDKQKACDVHT